jgi:hypothetical protein
VSGDTPTVYGCEQARKEQFRVPARAAPAEREAFMTILADGHTEHLA